MCYVKKNTMKLSKTQKNVIQLMQDGWELGRDNYRNRAWLQKNGLGCGGDTVDVNMNTFNSLYDKNLFTVKYNFPTSLCVLTKLGKTINLD